MDFNSDFINSPEGSLSPLKSEGPEDSEKSQPTSEKWCPARGSDSNITSTPVSPFQTVCASLISSPEISNSDPSDRE